MNAGSSRVAARCSLMRCSVPNFEPKSGLIRHVQVLKEAKQLFSQGARPVNAVPVVPVAEGMDEDTARCLCTLEEKLRLKRKQEVRLAFNQTRLFITLAHRLRPPCRSSLTLSPACAAGMVTASAQICTASP